MATELGIEHVVCQCSCEPLLYLLRTERQPKGEFWDFPGTNFHLRCLLQERLYAGEWRTPNAALRGFSANPGTSSFPASARVRATASADSILPVRPACAPARRDSAPDRAPVRSVRNYARVAPRTLAPAKLRHRPAAASPAYECPASAAWSSSSYAPSHSPCYRPH